MDHLTERVPVSALRKATISVLSGGLNAEKIIPTDEGLPRDWRGLAHLIGLNGVETNRIGASKDPVAELISVWGPKGSVEQLKHILAVIDRYDVLDDVSSFLETDVEIFRSRASMPSVHSKLSNCSASLDASILTVDDVVRLEQGLEPQQYDAYLLFADEDIDFASEIVDTMEKQYHMKLCIRDRDLVGGIAFEHDAIMKLIAERCRRLLVVVTPSFLLSSANKFFVTFAQALGIDQRQRKVIPILYKKCDLPPELSYYFLLDYSRAGLLWNFWEKLRDSIQTADTTGAVKMSPWMSKPVSKTVLVPEVEVEDDHPISEVKKPMFKNLTSSLTNLVVSKDKGKVSKNDSTESGKSSKKKWFGRRKVEPVLS